MSIRCWHSMTKRRHFVPPPAPMGPIIPEPPAVEMTDTERDWLDEMQLLMILNYLARHYGTTIEAQRERWAWYLDRGEL